MAELNKILKLAVPFTTKLDDNSDSGLEDVTIEGFASTQDLDSAGDVVLASAWTNGLQRYKLNPILLFNHDYDKPIGKAISVEVVSGQGLKIKGLVIPEADDNVYHLVKKGVLSTFSVGFRVKDAEYDSTTGIFVIKEAELYEISIVSVPANQASTFSLSKQLSSEEFTEFKASFLTTSPEEEANTQEEGENLMSDNAQGQVDSKEDGRIDAIEKSLETLIGVLAKQAEKPVEAPKVEVVADPAEKIQKAVEEALAKHEGSVSKALEEVRAEVKEKAAEIEALQKQKMTYQDKQSPVSEKEADSAVLLSKIMGRSINDTKAGKLILEKANAYLPGSNADWEQGFSNRLFEDMRQRLIVETLFSTVAMTNSIMKLPVSPEAGLASWVGAADFKSANSTPAASTHTLDEATLSAYKLATKESIGYEEEEDLLLPIIPIVRDAMLRRMARASDRAILRSTGAGNATNPSWKGLATLASDASATGTAVSAASGTVAIADLLVLRKKLGIYGLDPSAVTFIVSNDVYYDLLSDTSFKTMDSVGDNATLLTGQIGMALGSTVIASGEFAAKANGAAYAIAVYKPNFIVGNWRNMLVERDRDIQQQSQVLVASRRLAFTSLDASTGVAVGVYGA